MGLSDFKKKNNEIYDRMKDAIEKVATLYTPVIEEVALNRDREYIKDLNKLKTDTISEITLWESRWTALLLDYKKKLQAHK